MIADILFSDFHRLCDVCRYKQLERLAAEENERERPRTTRGRTEITLSLCSRSSSSSLTRSATPLTVEAQEDKHPVPHPARGEIPLCTVIRCGTSGKISGPNFSSSFESSCYHTHFL